MSLLRNFRRCTDIREAGELFILAEDREALSTVIANVRMTGHMKKKMRLLEKHGVRSSWATILTSPCVTSS